MPLSLWLLFQEPADTLAPDTTDTTVVTQDTTGTYTQEMEVVERGEYVIDEMRKPLLSPPFDPVELLARTLNQLPEGQEAAEAMAQLRDAVARGDTGAVSALGSVVIKGELRDIGGLLAAVGEFCLGQYGYALSDFKDFSQKHGGHPLVRVARAMAVLSALYGGSYREGMALGATYIETEVKEDLPGKEWNHWLLWATGECAYYAGDPNLAEMRYQEVITRGAFPEAVLWSRLGVAWCNLHQGRYENARSQADLVLLEAQGAMAQSAALAKAIAVFNLGNYREGYAQLASVDARTPPSLASELLYIKGLMAYFLRDFTAAERCLRKVVEDYGATPRARDAGYRLGELYAGEGRNQDAIAMYKWVKEQFPDFPHIDLVIYRLAELHFTEKEYEMALEYFKEYLDRFPNTTLAQDVRARLSQTYAILCLQNEDLVPEFETRCPQSKDVPDVLYHWGTVYYEEKNWEKAAHYFEKISYLYPKYPKAAEALYFAAICHYNMKDWNGAADMFKKLVDLYPDFQDRGKAMLFMGQAYVNAKRYGDAIKVLEELLPQLTDQRDKADAELALGIAYTMSANNPQKAKRYLEDARLLYVELGEMGMLETVEKYLSLLPD